MRKLIFVLFLICFSFVNFAYSQDNSRIVAFKYNGDYYTINSTVYVDKISINGAKYELVYSLLGGKGQGQSILVSLLKNNQPIKDGELVCTNNNNCSVAYIVWRDEADTAQGIAGVIKNQPIEKLVSGDVAVSIFPGAREIMKKNGIYIQNGHFLKNGGGNLDFSGEENTTLEVHRAGQELRIVLTEITGIVREYTCDPTDLSYMQNQFLEE